MDKKVIALGKLLETVLPLTEEKLKAEYYKRIMIFKEIIEAKEEDDEFFKSPSKYLKKRGALSIDRVTLPSGKRIPVIDDETTVKYFKDVRKKVKTGKSADWLGETSSGLIYQDYAVYRRRTLWTTTKCWTEVKADGSITKKDINAMHGPLISPKSNEDFKDYLCSLHGVTVQKKKHK